MIHVERNKVFLIYKHSNAIRFKKNLVKKYIYINITDPHLSKMQLG